VKAREGYKKVFDKGSVTDYGLTIRHKNGQLTDVLYNASVYTNEAGVVLGVFAAARDVTIKKDLEKKLAEYTKGLEVSGARSTKELATRVEELEQLNKNMIGRELKMIELKKEIERLKKNAEEVEN